MTKKVENPISRRTLVRGAALAAPVVLGATAYAQAAPGDAVAIPTGNWLSSSFDIRTERNTLDVPTAGGAVMESIGFNDDFRGSATLVKQNLPLTSGQRYRFTFAVQARLGGDPATHDNPAGWLDILVGTGNYGSRRFTTGPYPADFQDGTDHVEVIPPADWTQWGSGGVAGQSTTWSADFTYVDNRPFTPLNSYTFQHTPAALFAQRGFAGDPDRFRISVTAQQL